MSQGKTMKDLAMASYIDGESDRIQNGKSRS